MLLCKLSLHGTQFTDTPPLENECYLKDISVATRVDTSYPSPKSWKDAYSWRSSAGSHYIEKFSYFLMCIVVCISSLQHPLIFFFTYWVKTWVPNADLGDKIFWMKQQQSAAFGDLYQCASALNEYLSSSFGCSVNLSPTHWCFHCYSNAEKLRKWTTDIQDFAVQSRVTLGT